MFTHGIEMGCDLSRRLMHSLVLDHTLFDAGGVVARLGLEFHRLRDHGRVL